MPAKLEHVNITVADSARTAELMCRLFNWRIRWHGRAASGGTTYHVGDEARYVALYTAPAPVPVEPGALNHIGVQVDDLAQTEARVRAAGLRPFNHADYAPGRRFYFRDGDGVEYEVVSYSP